MFKRKVIIVSFISILAGLWIAGSVLPQEPIPGLIARWPFDEKSGDFIEDVAGEHDGEAIGGPNLVPGRFDNAIQFDRKDGQYIEVLADPELQPANALTVILWVKLDSPDGRQEIFCYGDAYVIHADGGVFKAYIHQGGGFPRAPGKTPVQTDRWYFLAMTYDDEDLKFYVDGELDATISLPGGIDFLGMPLRFGNNPAAPGEPWGISGILDEVELWDYPMTEEEILAAYEEPLAFLAVDAKGKLTTTWGGLKHR